MPDLDVVGAFLEPHHHELADEIGGFAAERVAAFPVAHDDDAARGQARELLWELGEGGWIRHAVPDPDLRALCLVRETLASVSPLADSVFALQGLGSMPLVLAGSREVKDRYLPDVRSGRAMAAFAMTEPGAGSDVASLSTRAVRDGGTYVLEGTKHLITNAGVADFYVVFASTDPEAGHRGLTAFVVDKDAPGFAFVGPQVLSEPHPLGTIRFEECRVPASVRLGAEGDGFRIGMRTLDRLRPTVAAAACGMAERALREALDHASSRRQFGGRLSDLQLIQQKLARMATGLTASRLLTYRAAARGDAGAERISLEAAMAKLHATETAQRVVDDAVQILGGRGVLADHPVDRLYRAVRALRIYEGTSEVQHLVIARQVLRRHEETS